MSAETRMNDRPRMPLKRLGVFAAWMLISTPLASGQELRDEFFWLGKMNKATAVINSQTGLLDAEMVPGIAAAIEDVIAAGDAPDGKRPSTVLSFEPLLIEAGSIDVTLLHAGRSSQDMLVCPLKSGPP